MRNTCYYVLSESLNEKKKKKHKKKKKNPKDKTINNQAKQKKKKITNKIKHQHISRREIIAE